MRDALPFTLTPPCASNNHSHCRRSDTRSNSWISPLPLDALPRVSDEALNHTCGPLRIHTVQHFAAIRLRNASFWNSWLRLAKLRSNASDQPRRKLRCASRLRAWRPHACELTNVFVAGASQTLFNASSFFGPPQRVATSLRPEGIKTVQARVEHAVLTRNEFGAGYYHLLFDTLASLAFLWPSLRNDPTAMFVLNPSTKAREQNGTTAPDIEDTRSRVPRAYASALLKALGIPPERVLQWPYTRQRSGPALAASRATFMCGHPFRATFQRDYWYVRQLRRLLHRAFRLPQHDVPLPMTSTSNRSTIHRPRLLLLVNRRGCTGGCDPSRNVRHGPLLLATLQRAFRDDRVVSFSGSEPVAEQAALFNRADLIAGPHGAAFANAIWCRAGAALIEFHRLNPWRQGTNSPLYALLSRILWLRYWVVLDELTSAARPGYSIEPQVLVETADAALSLSHHPGQAQGGAVEVRLPSYI